MELLLLKPVSWLGKAWSGHPWLWGWGDPKNRHVRLWVDGLRRWLTAAPLPVLAGVATYTAIFWVGFAVVARWLAPSLSGIEFDVGSIVGFVVGVLLTLAALVLATWVWLLGLGTFVLFRLAYRTVGMVGRPLLSTFLQTPAAPPWAGFGANEKLIRLRVPPDVTTLRVGREVDLPVVLREAEEATEAQLAGVVGSTQMSS